MVWRFLTRTFSGRGPPDDLGAAGRGETESGFAEAAGVVPAGGGFGGPATWADTGAAATVGARDGACAAEFGGALGDGEALAGARTAAVEPVAALERADVLAGAGAVEPVAALGRADVLVGAAALEPVAALGRADVLAGAVVVEVLAALGRAGGL